MKKIFALIGILTFVNVTLFAQSASTASLAHVFKLSGDMNQLSSPEVKESFLQLAQLSGSAADKATAEAKIDAYFESQIYTDIAEVVLPYYSNVSEADCNFLIEKFSQLKVAEALKHVEQANATLQKECQQVLMDGVQKIAMGQDPAKIEYESMSDEYRAKFEEYYKVADVDKIMRSALQSVQMMGASMQGEQREQFDVMMTKLQNYLSETFRPLVANELVKVSTSDDLQALIDVYSSDAGKHMTEGSGKMAADIMAVSMKIMSKVQESLK